MGYKGHVEKGGIVLDETVRLEEGTPVVVEIARCAPSEVQSGIESRHSVYREFIGALEDMPEDWAANHDSYLNQEHSE